MKGEFSVSIYDNLRLASYTVAADAFDKSKDVFSSFLPLVESAILASTDKASITFLALQTKINEIYKIKILKDTLRYLLRILEKQGKLSFVQNRTIVPAESMLNPAYIAEQEAAKESIEVFFVSFQSYLSAKNIILPLPEVRSYICNLIYAHSNELAMFIQDPQVKAIPSVKDYEEIEIWEYTNDFVSYMLDCKRQKLPEYSAFIKLFDGAIQSSLLNFTPAVIRDTVDKRFRIQVAILDTNFLLRLMNLQSELDNASAYSTWEDLRSSGTRLVVLRQTIEEICSSIKGFLNEIAPYAQQAQNFLRGARIRTSGFWYALQNGKSRTDFFELSKEENVRQLLVQNFSIEIVEDFDDISITQADIDSLILSKNRDSYGDKQARHDLLLLSYCRRKRPRLFSSISKAEWWVLTNDQKLAYWNQQNSHNIQECITETQLSNLLWLQAKKDCDEGFSNTIVLLASKVSAGTEAISVFARQITKYSEQYATDTSKLDDLSLVFASNTLSTDDILRTTTDEDEFAYFIAEKVEHVKQQHALDQAKREQLEQININSDKENSRLNLKIQAMERELTKTRDQIEYQSLKHQINLLEQKVENYQKVKMQIQTLIEFSEEQVVPSARFVALCLVAALLVFLFVGWKFAYGPIYNWVSSTTDWANTLLNIISSGIILVPTSLIYYFVVVILFGSPYKPAELFCHLRDMVVRHKLEKYILENDFPSRYSHINLKYQLQCINEEYDAGRKELVELRQQSKRFST